MRKKTIALLTLLVVLVIAAVATTTVLGIRYFGVRDEENARGDALDAAKSYAVTMFGFTPDNVSDHMTSAMSSVTGQAKTELESRIIDTRLVDQVKALKRISEAKIVNAGVVTNTADTAQVLIFLRQTVSTVGSDETGTAKLSRITFDMIHPDDKWLINQMTVITDQTLLDRVGSAGETTPSGAVPIPSSSAPSSSVPQPK